MPWLVVLKFSCLARRRNRLVRRSREAPAPSFQTQGRSQQEERSIAALIAFKRQSDHQKSALAAIQRPAARSSVVVGLSRFAISSHLGGEAGMARLTALYRTGMNTVKKINPKAARAIAKSHLRLRHDTSSDKLNEKTRLLTSVRQTRANSAYSTPPSKKVMPRIGNAASSPQNAFND